MNLRTILIIIFLSLNPAVLLRAQQVLLRFQDVSIADALTAINEHYPDNSIHFVRNELDTLYISKITLKGKDVLDDIQHIIGNYPVGIKIFGTHIFVEYKHKRPVISNLSLLPKEEDKDIAYSRVLSEVMVSNSLPLLNMNGSTMSLRIADTPLALAGSAYDLLYYLPDVQIGATGTVIRIDGKIVTNYSELSELDSEDVERIDYNDQPQYSSRQNVIIDIHTHRKQEDGYGIQLASQFSQGKRSRTMQLFKTNFHYGKWDLQANGTYRYDGIRKDLTINQYSFIDRFEQNSFHLNLAGEYQISRNFTLGVQYNLFTMLHPLKQERSNFYLNLDYNNLFANANVQNAASNQITTWNWQLDYHPQHDLNIYMKSKLGAWDLNAVTSLYLEGLEISEDTLVSITNMAHRSNEIKNTLWAIRADAARPLWNGQLQVMSEFAYTGRKDYHKKNMGQPSNGLLREQKLWSGSVSYRKRIGKIEGTVGMLGEIINAATNLQNIYPFANVGYMDTNQRIFLSYTRRSSMPTYGQTNGYAFNNIEILSVVGEPALRPSIIDQLQFKYLRGGFYGVVSWQFVNDYIAHSIEQYGENYCSRYRNLDYANLYFAALSYHHSLGKWSSQYTATLRGQKIESWDKSFCKPIIELKWDNQFQFPYNITAMFRASYHTSGHEGTTWQKQVGEFGITIAKETKNWTLQLTASDIFRTNAIHTIYYAKDSEYSRMCYEDNQRIQLTFRINLGSLSRRSLRTISAGSNERERL